MKSSKINKPRVLLIGAGAFGWNHLLDWIRLERQGAVSFAGVVARDPAKQKKIRALKVPVFSTLTTKLLRSVDGVDIVTPAGTHYALAKKCLLYTNVLLEKPMTLSTVEARRLNYLAAGKGRQLMIGHIYRFNGAIQALKKMIAASRTKPFYIETVSVHRPRHLPTDCGVLFSDLHGFDMLDYLLEDAPQTVYAVGPGSSERFEHNAIVLLRYPAGINAVVKLSWTGAPKTRSMMLLFPDKTMTVDLLQQKITVDTATRHRVFSCFKIKPLTAELACFGRVLIGGKVAYPDGKVGIRIVRLVEEIRRSYRKGHPVAFNAL